MNMAKHFRLVLVCLSAVLLLGSVPVVIKLIKAGPWTIAVSRLLLGALCIGAYGFWRRDFQRLHRGSFVTLALMGLCFGVHWITYFFSIKLSSPALAIVTLSVYSPCLIVWGRLLLGRRIYPADTVALCLAVIGTLFCVPDLSFRGDMTLGFLLGIASGTIYALLPILQQKNADYPVTLKAFGQFSFALLAFLPFASWTDWNLSQQDWLGLLYLGLCGTFIAHTLWVDVTTRLSPTSISVLSYAQIPVAMFLSLWMLGDALRWQLLLGAMLIFTANLVSIVFRVRRNATQ